MLPSVPSDKLAWEGSPASVGGFAGHFVETDDALDAVDLIHITGRVFDQPAVGHRVKATSGIESTTPLACLGCIEVEDQIVAHGYAAHVGQSRLAGDEQTSDGCAAVAGLGAASEFRRGR